MTLIKGKSSSAIHIPEAFIEIINNNDKDGIPTIRAYWHGSDTEFLNHSPVFWLERYRPKRNVSKHGTKVVQGIKWVHPTHLDGSKYSGGRFYSGIHTNSINGIQRTCNTEWDIVSGPYDRMVLDINPFEWFFRHFSAFPMTSIFGVPHAVSTFNETGESLVSKRIRARFRVRIAIKNPDVNAVDPVIKGPVSQEFFIRPNMTGGIMRNFVAGFSSEN